MKKKILIALFVAALVCLFSFTVSAANEVTFTDGTTADLAAVFNVSNDTINNFNTGYSKENIKDVVFPDYITTIKNVSFASSTVIQTVAFEAKDTLVLDGVSFNASSVQKVTFVPDCVLQYKSGNFYNCKSLTEITFPKFLALTGNCFQLNSNMVPTNNIVFVEGVTTINCHIFNGCNKVGGEIVFPSTLEVIKEGTFTATKISSYDFSKCVNLTSIGGGYGGTFSNNDVITSYDFSACTKLTKFDGPAMFEGSENLVSVILPPNLSKIPHKTLAHCYKMESLVIPATVTDIADESFHSARRGQSVMTFTMYIQGNVKLNTKYVFRDSGAKVEFVLLGDSITVEQFRTTNAGIDIVQSGSHSPFDSIEAIDYLDPSSPWTFVPGQARASHIIVGNFCTSLALNGEHLSDENPCVIYCSDCEYAALRENPQHTLDVSVEYANGYASVGTKIVACTNEGCPHKETTEMQALFICFGYSSSKVGNGGMLMAFAVNQKAIEEFEGASKSNISYGVFAGLKDRLSTNDAVTADGKAQNGAICADYTEKKFDIIEIKVAGFTSNEHMDAQIVLGAYVIVNKDGSSTISYLQDKAPLDNEKYVSRSYNQLID